MSSEETNKTKEQNEEDIQYFGKLKSFDFSFVKDCDEKLDVIPMEVDRSLEEKKDVEETDVEIVDADNKLRKRRRVKKDEQDQGNPRKILKGSDDPEAAPSKFRAAKLLFLFLMLPAISYLSLIHNNELSLNDNFKVLSHNIFRQRDKCDHLLDINPIINSLKQNIFGQDAAIENLAKNFYTKNFKTLILTGPTGVGKSYSVAMIEQSFTWTRNVQNVIHPLSKSDLQVLKLTLSDCGYNLIVFDGLGSRTPEGLYDAIRSIQQYSYEKNMKTIVILVYSTQELTKDLVPVKYNYSKDILGGFQKEFKSAMDVSLIEFGRLVPDNIISCVKAEANKLNLAITKEEATAIASEIPNIYGCKGARAKLMLLKPEEEN